MKTKLAVIIFLLMQGIGFAQVNTPDYAKYYYKVTVQNGTNRVMDHSLSTGNISSTPYHGGKNQQWAIMPLYITAKNGALVTSNEYVFGSRSNGKNVDISNNVNIQCYSPFHAGNNQLFTLKNVGNQIFEIHSPWNVNKVFDRSGTNEINFSVWHGGSNQQFALTTPNSFVNSFGSLRSKNPLTAPLPPIPTSFTGGLQIETEKTFMSEVLLPYLFVKNDLPISNQAENTPYYKLVKYEYYKLPNEIDHDYTFPAGSSVHTSVRIKVGTNEGKVTEVTTKLSVGFTSASEIGFKLGEVLSVKTSQALNAAFERGTKVTTSWSELNESEEIMTIDYPFSVLTRMVIYQKMDYYELYRAGETTPFLYWEVKTNQAATVFYTEGSGGGRMSNSNNVVEFTIEDGKTIPISSEKPTSETQLNPSLAESPINAPTTFDFNVSPNPSKGIYNIKFQSTVSPNLSISVYNQTGSVVYQDKKSKASANDNTVELNLSHLPAGPYLLKVVNGKSVVTKHISKE